jgi:hypothetical protein
VTGEVFLARHRPTGEKVALEMTVQTVERPQISEQTMKEVRPARDFIEIMEAEEPDVVTLARRPSREYHELGVLVADL